MMLLFALYNAVLHSRRTDGVPLYLIFLQEASRVLKPGCPLIFVEKGD